MLCDVFVHFFLRIIGHPPTRQVLMMPRELNLPYFAATNLATALSPFFASQSAIFLIFSSISAGDHVGAKSVWLE